MYGSHLAKTLAMVGAIDLRLTPQSWPTPRTRTTTRPHRSLMPRHGGVLDEVDEPVGVGPADQTTA
jgi:hypothetical protein